MDNLPLLTALVAVILAILVALYIFTSSAPKKAKKIVKQRVKLVGPFTREEVSKHNTRDDAWIIVDNNVYDVTDFVDMHPGGDSILKNVGGDSTEGESDCVCFSYL